MSKEQADCDFIVLLSKRSEVFSSKPYTEITLFYERKEGNKGVNIFHRYNYHVNRYASTPCKTYCFAFQKWLFCTVKA